MDQSDHSNQTDNISEEKEAEGADDSKRVAERKGMKVLLAGPYIGELGWEVFSFQPLVRANFIASGMDKCIVYTRPGRERLYPWAEVRTMPMPTHESECHAWHGMDQSKSEELQLLINTMVEQVKAEQWGEIKLLTQAQIPQLNNEYFERGKPDLLRPNKDALTFDSFQLSGFNPNKKTVTLCIRDREMSDFRNLEYADWEEIVEALYQDYNVIIVGKVQRPDDWFDFNRFGVIDLTNKTTISDLIDIFWISDLVVGGSTGPIHLASRCGRDHLVWAGEKEINRYAETNWFGANHKVYVWGWQPDIDVAVAAIRHKLETNQWL